MIALLIRGAVVVAISVVVYMLSPVELFVPVMGLVASTAAVGFFTNTLLQRVFPEEEKTEEGGEEKKVTFDLKANDVKNIDKEEDANDEEKVVETPTKRRRRRRSRETPVFNDEEVAEAPTVNDVESQISSIMNEKEEERIVEVSAEDGPTLEKNVKSDDDKKIEDDAADPADGDAEDAEDAGAEGESEEPPKKK